MRIFFKKFKQHRLAYSALLVWLGMVFVIGLTPIIANDKPILVRYQHTWYVPVFYDYPETTFGGVFETPTNYKDPMVKELIQKNGMMIMPWIAYDKDTLVLDVRHHPSPPNVQHWLGTDEVGRDVLSRVLYGLRISLVFGLALTVLGSVIGVAIGALMGYFGGLVDLLGHRLIEIWLGLPQLFILMILARVFEPSALVLFVIMLLFAWLPLVSVTRVHFLRLRHSPYVLVAKNLGVSSWLIIWRHILPSVLVLSLAQLPFVLAANIVSLTALDFLGLGLPLGSASLGELLLQGKNHLDVPHLLLSGFGVLFVLLVLLIFIGEGFRQSLLDNQDG